ncbi:MAG: riboflavin kinase, partial [Acidimicrobiales bacterium]
YYLRPDGVPHVAALSVGRRPTFYAPGSQPPLLEAFLLDFDDDLYSEEARVRFVERLRGEERFDRVEDLVAQMHRDVAQVRRLLGGGAPDLLS